MSVEPTSPRLPLKRYVRAVGPRLRLVLYVIFALFAVLGANSLYLGAVTVLEFARGRAYENYFYQWMFLVHLVLGLLLIAPVVGFGIAHLRNAHDRPNRRAVQMGYVLFGVSLVLLLTGVALMRLGWFEIRDPRLRSPLYWAHVIAPCLAVWLYVIHRLAGPRINWRLGLRWAGAMAALVAGMFVLHLREPRGTPPGRPSDGDRNFGPSLARTATGNFIPAKALMLDQYCQRCHPDSYRDWFHSAHHYSSFNNPPYRFSVRETRQLALKRDGNVRAARWCAGCHDPAPFFSGAFDNPAYDDLTAPTSQAGITCVSCHAITRVNSTRGNADFTITVPVLYPFTYSDNPVLKYINETLVKAKPSFHNRTFLRPVHKSAEFCSTCHKVSIPYELNKYKEFLRGQNHYDGYLLSAASGHGARSFYYPPVAKQKCADCHMPLHPSADFGARFNATGAGKTGLTIHNHTFPGANTGLAALKQDDVLLQADTAFVRSAARIDLFGIKDGGTVDSPLTAPLRPGVPTLLPGHKYLLEVVVRTLGVGHPFTQGTVDSNEVWVDATVMGDNRVLGRSGGLGPHREVDPWSHFINVYMLDRNGRRIDRRNAQDIFTPLYDHQIPPGSGQVVHYEFTVPAAQRTPLRIRVALQYRKFDAVYLNYLHNPAYAAGAPLTFTNDLPVVTISSDEVVFPVGDQAEPAPTNSNSPIEPWERWNDYGIGLLLEGDRGSEKGELIQAAAAFSEVERLGHVDGPLNLARVHYKEGRLDAVAAALQRAAQFHPAAPRWTMAWLNGLASKQAGDLDGAIIAFRSIVEDRYPELEQRHLDFSKDYLVLDELGQTLVERAKAERGAPERKREFLRQAADTFERALAVDAENVAAHYNLALVYAQLGNASRSAEHRRLYERYRVDDNAADRAIALARARDPAADQAADAIVIHSLQRSGAFELPPQP
jgi:tetratricopeptide (TPR) repeat protein